MRKFREKVAANSQLKLRPDRDIENAFRAYETSWETERLDSEQSRQIFCEFIDLGRRETLEEDNEIPDGKITKQIADKSTFDDSDSDEDTGRVESPFDVKAKWWTELCVQSTRPGTLKDSVAERLGKLYKGGSIDGRVAGQDAANFGLNVDVNLPIMDLIELNVIA